MRNRLLGTIAALLFTLGSTPMSQHTVVNPSNWNETIRQLVAGQPNIITITTPATSLQELQIRHGLGRMPKGWAVIKGDPGNGGSVTLTPTVNTYTRDITAISGKSVISCEVDLLTGDVFFSDAGHYSGLIEGSFYALSYSATQGFVCPRAGSITGISILANVTAAGTGDGVITIQARKNGTNVYSVSTAAIASTGIKTAYGTQAAGTDTFAAGDIISIYSALTFSGTQPTTPNLQSWVELSYDNAGSISDQDTTYTAAGGGTSGAVAGATAWDTSYLYLKFVATSTELTIAVW